MYLLGFFCNKDMIPIRNNISIECYYNIVYIEY